MPMDAVRYKNPSNVCPDDSVESRTNKPDGIPNALQ